MVLTAAELSHKSKLMKFSTKKDFSLIKGVFHKNIFFLDQINFPIPKIFHKKWFFLTKEVFHKPKFFLNKGSFPHANILHTFNT